MPKRSTILFLLFIFFCIRGNAQNLHTHSNQALKAYNSGKVYYEFFDFRNAEKWLKDAIKIDNSFYEAYMMLGEMMTKQRRFSESADYYKRAVRIDSLFYKPVFFPLANAEMMCGRYSDALIDYNVYLVQPGISEKNRQIALKSVDDCKFAINSIKNPVPFSPVNLGDSINTTDDEYWPSITVDGQTFMFTRQVSSGPGKQGTQEDFYISHLKNNHWSKALNAGAPLNTPQNEGAQTLSSDGRYMYFTACDRPGGQGKCDIYYSSFDGRKWTFPLNIGRPVNTSAWESQPSISANGKMLFFTSNRPGGLGGMDLWYSILGESGSWKTPVNLGNKIILQEMKCLRSYILTGKLFIFRQMGELAWGELISITRK